MPRNLKISLTNLDAPRLSSEPLVQTIYKPPFSSDTAFESTLAHPQISEAYKNPSQHSEISGTNSGFWSEIQSYQYPVPFVFLSFAHIFQFF